MATATLQTLFAALFGLGLALVWVALALTLNDRRSQKETAMARAYVEPPEEERTGA